VFQESAKEPYVRLERRTEMKPAPTSSEKLTLTNAHVPALVLVLAALGGCQALDNASGVNRQDYDVRKAATPEQTRPDDVPSAMKTEQSAKILLDQGFREQALAAFERAISENPLATTSYLGAGDLYFERGDISTAQKRFEVAASTATTDETRFEANYKNGLMLQLSRRVGEAVSAYLRALAINPYEFHANLNTGTAYLQLKEPKQAVKFAERAVDLKPQSAEARANLGAIYAELGRHADAVAQYREAAQLRDLQPPLLLNLANSLGKLSPPQYGQMLNTLDELIRLEPSSPIAHERRAFALFKLNRREEAMNSCRAALALDERHYPAWNILGVIRINDWLESGSDDEPARQEALDAWRRSLRIEERQSHIKELLTRFQG
jgi:tetratricopeptide (TPR) repeat protein